ncbi:hypothetical protein JAAARDRAFT_203058 [Jaapia argillacea MUCL 33604]|uniref:Zn(2)-C6 fungal-type domain-containing protein n=1 Tax=Jaapia argillacea MUCL 33604 TaxID=933084 RepID=A0A067Q9L0_9AGAM|nr:hypothetical protein JAAARDRAFT_203058 [Jaapia argillacea MUCL 33604]
MPKAPSTGTSSSRPALRRNQACLSCRKRKLKCDAARPHCATCVKQWQAQISVPAPPGYVHPTEPLCSYDPVEGLPLAPNIDPADKIKLLEEQISKLKRKLNDKGLHDNLSDTSRTGTPSHSPRNGHSRSHSQLSPPSHSPALSSTSISPGSGLAQTSQDGINALLNVPTENHLRSESGSPELNGLPNRSSSGSSGSLRELIHSGWNPDLPDPAVLHHYVDNFFKCDPCGSRTLHQPSFMASLQLHPHDPGFPHSAILHAICASASRWSSQTVTTLSDGSRRDAFAEFHAGKTRQYIDKTMASGEDIFAVMQACLLLSWYFYQEGRWVEVWIFAGFQTRVAIPLRLNYPGTFTTHGNSSPGAYLAPPRDLKDLESRRRTWWMTIVFDRIASVGGWVHGIDERDIGTELPLRRIDFESEHLVPNNPQDLCSPGVFTTHPPQYTDSFLLLIKAVMLFGKVTDYNVRSNLRAPAPPSKNQDPFHLPDFEALDSLVCVDFLESLPSNFKNVFDMHNNHAGGLDTDLYLVHIIPHAATITLHNPYLDFSRPTWISTSRCMNSARAIIEASYLLSSTSLDLTRLHPFVTICWYLAAVIQVQLCKYFIEIGDTEGEAHVWGEINVLRFAMLEYGARSPIGTRQEKLLQGLMTEIVRMTTQRRPLEVGLPLYPFSHAGVFPKNGSAGSNNTTSLGAPLPSTNFEDVSPPGSSNGHSQSGISHSSGWSSRSAHTSPPQGPAPMPPPYM